LGFAFTATLCTPEEGLSARRAVVALTNRTGPFHTAFLVAEQGNLFTPDGDGFHHHPFTRLKSEAGYLGTWPVRALVARVETFGSDTIPDRAHGAIAIEFLGRIRLHAPQALSLFGLSPIEVPHDGPELFIFIACGDVNTADTAIEPAGGHEILVPDLSFSPSFHESSSSFAMDMIT
jgi:hypothetical protein